MKNTQIHVVKSLIYTIVVTLIASVFVYKSTAYFFANAAYKDEMADATVTLKALKHLQLGEINQAIDVLEGGLKGNLAALDVDSTGIPGRTYTSMKYKVEEIKDYLVDSTLKK